MTKEKNEEALQKIKTIHPDLRRAIASSANADKIFDIGKNYNLQVDKIGELASETMYLMLGITHPNEFVGNLAERLQIDHASASKIADDINREIFAPVREHLRSLFGITPAPASDELKPPPLSPRKNSSDTVLSAISRQPAIPVNDAQKQTSLEDLEAELEQALAEEKGIQPLSMVKKPTLAPKPITSQKPSYKGIDPYREQVEDDLPNVRGKAYVPQSMEHGTWNMEQKKNTIPNPTSGFIRQPADQVSRIQPTPTPKPVEENSVFSPLNAPKQTNNLHQTQQKQADQAPKADPYREPIKQKDTLTSFRGFKMSNGTVQTTTPQGDRKEKDPYKEPLM